MNQNRIAIVTGGLQGIGLAIAAELARRGMRVAVGARRGGDSGLADAAADAIGNGCLVAALDVRSVESVGSFLEEVHSRLGDPGILVNAAGVTIHQSVEGHPEDVWLDTIDINLSGPFRMIRACLPQMKRDGWGRIVNIASTAAHTADETHAAYCASKTGLLGLTRAVALEGAPHGVTCVSVSPGWVETDMLRESAAIMAHRSGRSQAEEIALMAAANPQNRLVQPREIASLVAFCCSDEAAGLTMEDIQVAAGALW